MDIVANDQEIAGGRIGTVICDVGGEKILGVLDQCGRIVQIVRGVQVKVCRMVSHGLEITGAGCGACRVWGAHVGWDNADDVTDCHLVVVHLVVELRLGQGVKVLMGPGMTGNLVTRCVHSLHEVNY